MYKQTTVSSSVSNLVATYSSDWSVQSSRLLNHDDDPSSFIVATQQHTGLSPSHPMGTPPVTSVFPKRTPFSLPNGTSLHKSRCPQGIGHVQISNGTNSDARVQLYSANSGIVCRDYYIRAGEQWTLNRMGIGTYRLRFILGTDWDVRQRKFATSSASEFDGPLDFEEQQQGARTSYNYFEASLHTTPLGNAPTHTVDASYFQCMTQRNRSQRSCFGVS